jgi:hypothetical protein
MKILKAALPHLLAIAIGAILVMLFFSPLFFENKIIDQNDIYQGIGAGEEIRQYREKTGEEALWTTSMFSGMPAYLINISYSGELVKHLHRVLSLGMPSTAQVVFLAYLSFYILLIAFRVHPLLAIAGAIAYSFNTFNLVSVEAGHIWKVRAIAYMPLVVAGVRLIFANSQKWLGIGVLSIAVALELHANHLQITYYLFLFLMIFGITQLIKTVREKAWVDFSKNVSALLLAALLGIGANAARLWTTMEYSKYSTRGATELTSLTTGTSQQSGLDRDYVFNWSYGVMESFTLLIPNFSGGASAMPLDTNSNLAKTLASQGASTAQIREQISRVPTYWGDQPGVAGPSYVGAIVIFLVVLSWFYVEKSTRNWLLIAAGFGLILSWGKNFESFNYLMFDYFPAYSKFRSVSMAMVILLLSLPLLGLLALDGFIRSTDKDKMRKLVISSGAVAGLCLLFALFGGVILDFRGAIDSRMSQLPDWYLAAIRMDRKAMMVSDAFRSAVLIALSFAIILAFLKKKINYTFFGTLIILVMLLDFYSVGNRFFNDAKYIRGTEEHTINPSAADQRIMDLEGDNHYRVMNLQDPFNEAYTSAFHSSIGGYHGAKMKRYMELINYAITPELTELINELRSGNTEFSKYYIINMLNAKYIKYGSNEDNIIPNLAAFGNAWLANSVYKAENADNELKILNQLEERKQVVINESKFGNVKEQYPGSGSIELRNYQPNQLTYQIKTDDDGLAVFSEIYYPIGWTATIDGAPAPILQANYVLRALEVPKGEHEIVFKFNPDSYRIGNHMTLIFSVLMFGFFGFGMFKSKIVSD